MAEPSAEDVALARELLELWDEGRGISKSQLEIKVWDDATSHGRHFDRFIAKNLGVSTTRVSKQTDRIAQLERQIRSLGEQPIGTAPAEWEAQLQHARQSCLQALRVWNDPTSSFRTSAFSMLFVTAWNSIAIAWLQREDVEWREIDDDGQPILVGDGVAKSRETRDLVADAFAGDHRIGLRANVEFWIDIRNAVAHRSLPAVDAMVIPHAQAGLLNFETILVEEFGSEYALAEALSVPLQLGGFRDPGVLASRKKLLSSLPIEVQAVLSRAESADPELAIDPTFMLRVAFIPTVPPSGRNPDAVAYFVRPDEVPDELSESLDRYVVLPKPRKSAATLRTRDVCEQVTRRTGFKFHWNHHAAAARTLGAWPVDGSDVTVEPGYAEYHSAFKGWLYSQAWIDLLVTKLDTHEGFLEVTGIEPRRAPSD